MVAPPLLLLFFPKLQERGILAGNRTRALLNTSEASGRDTEEGVGRLDSPAPQCADCAERAFAILLVGHLNGCSN